MRWQLIAHPDFDAEISGLPEAMQAEIFAAARLLEFSGPLLGRTHVDTLKGSRVPNLKELRCVVGGAPWRIAFAFDPVRRAVLLVGGSKSGVKSDLFYKRLIRISEKRWQDHLQWTRKNS